MQLLICFIIIYILEGLIFWQYCINIFPSKHKKQLEGISFFIGYLLLFFISLLEKPIINLIAFFLVNFILCLVLFVCHWFSALFHALITAIIMMLSEHIVFTIISASHFIPNFYEKYTDFRSLIMLAIATKLIYFLILQMISLHIGKHQSLEITNTKGTFLLRIVPFLSTFIVLTLAIIYATVKMTFIFDALIIINEILLLVINLLIARLFSYIQKKNKEFLTLQLQLQKEYDTKAYFDILLSQNEKQKILIHDIRKHLNSILLLNKQNESEQITNYINQIIQSSNLQDTVQVSDNKLLNGILQQYIIKCNENHIKFKTDIRSGVIDFLSHDELTSLFCNLLDNSITAASNIPNSFIELSVTKQPQKSFIIISMINSCKSNPFSNDGKLKSTKPDSWRHGYGLKSIQNVIEQHNGSMKLYYDDNTSTFHSILLINIK